VYVGCLPRHQVADEECAGGHDALIGHPPRCGATEGRVASGSAAAGRGPIALAAWTARVRPAPPGGASCQKRQQDVAPVRARQ
jgi:hypothetical protein